MNCWGWKLSVRTIAAKKEDHDVKYTPFYCCTWALPRFRKLGCRDISEAFMKWTSEQYLPQVRDFHHDGVERASERWRVGICRSCQGEAASAGVTSSQSWSRAEGQLVDGRGEA